MKRFIPFVLGGLFGAIHCALTIGGLYREAWLLEAVLGVLEKVMENRRCLFWK
jgi:hypothetical protein